jgi:hypothetical protein
MGMSARTVPLGLRRRRPYPRSRVMRALVLAVLSLVLGVACGSGPKGPLFADTTTSSHATSSGHAASSSSTAASSSGHGGSATGAGTGGDPEDAGVDSPPDAPPEAPATCSVPTDCPPPPPCLAAACVGGVCGTIVDTTNLPPDGPCTTGACSPGPTFAPMPDGTACWANGHCTAGACTGCMPTVTCQSPLNYLCGSQLGDGCGGILNCGTCPTGYACEGCNDGGVVAACVPTCATLGFNCGEVDRGCGQIGNCGTCQAPQVCGGGGKPNVCG